MDQPNVKIQNLGGVVLITPDIHMWSGSKRLTAEALIAKNPAFKDLPPKSLASLGGTKIVDPTDLAPIKNKKHEAMKLLSTHGLPFMKGWAIPDSKFDFVFSELVRIQEEFTLLVKDLYQRYDMAIRKWRDAKENAGWAHLISDIPTAEYVAGVTSFAFHPLRIESPSPMEDHPANAIHESKMTGLKGELFKDIAQEADVLIEKYLMFVEDGSNTRQRRDVITQRTLRPLKRIAEKLSSFSFLDRSLMPLVGLIEDVLNALPDGRIEGKELISVWSLALTLVDPEKAMRVAEMAYDPETVDNALEQVTHTAPVVTGMFVNPVAVPVMGCATTTNLPATDLDTEPLPVDASVSQAESQELAFANFL